MTAVALLATLTTFGRATPASAATLPPGFQQEVVLYGLTLPTSLRFSPDGRVFVAEKSGLIKVFDNLSDQTPTVFADLRTNVHNYWDRGLLSLALAPNFPTDPWVYVLYTYDAAIGGTAPRWGSVGGTSDACPTPPGGTDDGCVVTGRLSRLRAAGNTMTGSEQVLIEGWCQQYPSHSMGGLAFGADGALYVSAGEGASFNFVDYGQDGAPVNPCGDPPGGVGGSMTPPTAEGGSLRSQDLLTQGDPVGLSGAILRVNPATGQGLPDNPLASSSDANARRIVAHGLRNPFRITTRPGTDEIWIGDVGWADWEEIDRLIDPRTAPADNFGWPCYEGDGRQSGFDAANLNLCENLYAQGSGAVAAPYFRYRHSDLVVPNEACPVGGSSIAGIAFAPASGGSYPAEYRSAMFVADYTRHCIWAVPAGSNGLPDMSQRRTFVAGAAEPVDLQIGPGGDLFYVDFGGGAIWRIRYFSQNRPPVAVATANPTNGAAPLTVRFDGSTSSDADGDALTFAWDLDGDGAFDDATGPTPQYTYNQVGSYIATLRVSDPSGASGTSPVSISVGNTAPTAFIDSPAAGTTWRVGDVIAFSGHATDPQQGTLGAAALTWDLVMQHCPSTCHEHPLQTFSGVASGTFTAPDHEYPSHVDLRLTAIDAGGLTSTMKTVRLDPKTVDLTFNSSPSGLTLAVGSASQATPFTRTAILGSSLSVSAPAPQALGGSTYGFLSWSDGGAQTHNITANATGTFTATYTTSPTTSPGVPSGLKGMTAGSEASLWWTPPTGGPVAAYEVHRGQADTFVPSLTTLVGSTTQPKWSAQSIPSGTWYYRVLARDAAGNASAATPSIRSVVSPGNAVTVVRDDFARSISGGWGSAPLGGSWSAWTESSFAVGSGLGNVVNETGGSDRTAWLTATDVHDIDATIVFRTDTKALTGNGQTVKLLTRRQASYHEYRSAVQLRGDGAMSLMLQRIAPNLADAGTTVAVPGGFVRGRDYAIRTSVTGANPTTLRAKVWDASTSEPTGWTATWTDSTASLQGAGDVGISSYVSGSASGTPVTSAVEAILAASAAPSDTTAPSAPGTPSTTVSGSTVTVSWGAASDNIGVAAYRVYRGTSAGFTVGSATLRAEVAGTTWADQSVPAGSWYYRVVAVDAAGNAGPASGSALAVVQAPAQQTVQVTASADTWVNSAAPTSTAGTSWVMRAKGASGTQVPYMRFVVPAAPAGKTLSAARLQLTTSANAWAGTVAPYEVRRVDSNSWAEATMTWDSRPAVSTTILGTLAGGSALSQTLSTSLTVNALPGAGGSVSVALTGSSADNLEVFSKENATGRPTLILTYT